MKTNGVGKGAALVAWPELENLFDHLPAAAYLCDTAGLITYYNCRAEELWGRAPRLRDPADRYCGSFRLYALDGQAIEHEACWMAKAIQGDCEYNGCEIVIERPDGSRLTALAFANPLHDASGALVGAISMLVDVGDRRQAEEARAWMASIVSSSDDAIVSKTLEGRILSWNQGAERLFGYTRAEAVGQSIMIIIPPDREDEERSILARLARGERIDHYETVRRTKEGRRVEISLTSSPVRDAAGKIVGVSKVARDIGARKRADEALISVKDELAVQVADLRRLQEMSLRLSTTLELQPILDTTLRTVLAIQGADMGLLSLCVEGGDAVEIAASVGFDADFLERMHRMPAGEGACGSALKERRRIVVENVETDSRFAPYRAEARRAGFRSVHSVPLLARDGRVIGVLSTHFRPLRRPTEREIGLLELCVRQAVDCIENARLYAEVREGDRRKDEFLAILAHELRNPLAPMRNALELLRRDSGTPSTVERTRLMMERQLDQMVRLVDDLMDVSRITRNRLVLRKEQVELGAVLRSAAESVAPLVDVAGHELLLRLPPQPIYLEADHTRLAQVFANLLNNAVKYTDPGGRIEVICERDGQDVVVRVRDNGMGIPPAMLPRVFDMFTQVDPSIERSQGGLGIGLSLVRGLVTLHGGVVEASSAGERLGSEFTVRLPVLVGWRPPAGRSSAVARPHSKAPPPRVLVVDDNEDAAISLAMMLEMMGHEVRTASDGVEALETAEWFRPEAIFLDIGLPKLDGYEVAKRIRAGRGGQEVFLVAVTGWGQDDDKRRSAIAGFNLHLVKPMDPRSLEGLLAGLRSGAGN